jgi:hypothetical protein
MHVRTLVLLLIIILPPLPWKEIRWVSVMNETARVFLHVIIIDNNLAAIALEGNFVGEYYKSARVCSHVVVIVSILSAIL